jgi:hypothetical protein
MVYITAYITQAVQSSPVDVWPATGGRGRVDALDEMMRRPCWDAAGNIYQTTLYCATIQPSTRLSVWRTVSL